MEDNNELQIEEKEVPISKTYQIDGCIITVRRKFEKGGTGILEQVVSLLLDILDKKELEEKTSEN